MEPQDYKNRKYMIFNVSELSQIDFTKVLDTSSNTIRKSIDGSKTFVKWENNIPDCVFNLKTKEGPYTYEEILLILLTTEWYNSYPSTL